VGELVGEQPVTALGARSETPRGEVDLVPVRQGVNPLAGALF